MANALQNNSFGRGYEIPLSKCPVQREGLVALSVCSDAGAYGHGHTEWYSSFESAQKRLQEVPIEGRWRGEKAEQGAKPIKVFEGLWKVIFKYSPSFWV